MNKNKNRARKFKELNDRQLNKKDSTKNQRRGKEIVDTELAAVSKSNPFDWYNRFPEYIKSTANLSFGYPVGQKVMRGASSVIHNANQSIVGLMKLSFTPTIGLSEDKNSPINRAAIRYYVYLRHAQKASAKYDSQDMMMGLTALDSLYMFHSTIKRIYGITQLYTPVNKYYPRAILQSMNVDTSILDDPTQLWGYVNQFAISLGSYTAPKDMQLYARHQWMCEGLYTDSVTNRAQTYYFMPEMFWYYDNTVSTGSQLTPVKWQNQAGNNDPLMLEDIKAIGKKLINGILADEDIGNICGDIFNAVGEEGCVRLAEIPADYKIYPAYDEVVLTQIQNSVAVGALDATTLKITQDPSVNSGAILCSIKPASTGTRYNLALAPVLNLRKDNPTPEDVVEATRMMCCANPRNYSGTGVVPEFYYAADIINYYHPYMLYWNTTDGTESYTDYTFSFTSSLLFGSTAASNPNYVAIPALLATFDWNPIVRVFFTNNASTNPVITYCGAIGDIDNIAVLSPTDLRDIHEACMISLFDTKQMGFTNQ